MATREEIKVKTGIDNLSIAAGMRDLNAKVKSGTDSLANQFKGVKSDMKGIGDLIKGFGATRLVNDFKPLIEITASFFGKFSAGGFAAEARLEAMRRGLDKFTARFKQLNKERFEEEKKVKDLTPKVAEKQTERNMVNATSEERLAQARKELEEAARNQMVIGASESKRLQLNLEYQEKSIAHAKALKEFAEEREKKEKESAKEKEKAAKKEKEVTENLKRQDMLLKQLNAEYIARDKAGKNQGLEKYMSSVQEIASDPNSLGRRDAQRLMFLQKDQERVLRTFGREGANQNYLAANEKEIQRLDKSLKDRGFIPDDKFEKLSESAKTTADKLEQVVNEGLRIKDDE